MSEFKKYSLVILASIPLAIVTVLATSLVNGAFGVFGAWSTQYLDSSNYNIREAAVVSTFHGLLMPLTVLTGGLIAIIMKQSIDPNEKILGHFFVNPKSPLDFIIPISICLGSHIYLSPVIGQKVINNFPTIKDFLTKWSGKELEMNTRDYNTVMGLSWVTYALTLGSISFTVASYYDTKRIQPISSQDIGNNHAQTAEQVEPASENNTSELSQQEDSNITVTVPGNIAPR